LIFSAESLPDLDPFSTILDTFLTSIIVSYYQQPIIAHIGKKEVAMNTSRLMIVAGEKAWTLAAMHLACAIARRSGLEVTLVKMIPVQHPLYLGTSAGMLNYSGTDTRSLKDMRETAEDYAITLNVQLFQYVNFWPGVADAARQLRPTAVIAQIPASPLPYLRELRQRWLRRKLAGQGQLFFTLDELTPSISWTPSMALQNDIAHSIEQHRFR
jgi:hypothetical protein